MEEPYSKRELDNFFGGISDHLKTQDEILVRIEDQTKKTNGRVTRLEDWSVDAKKIIESSAKMIANVDKDYEKSKVRMYTALGVLIFCAATIASLSVMAAKSFIKQQIQNGFSSIEKRYNINVDN